MGNCLGNGFSAINVMSYQNSVHEELWKITLIKKKNVRM